MKYTEIEFILSMSVRHKGEDPAFGRKENLIYPINIMCITKMSWMNGQLWSLKNLILLANLMPINLKKR